MLNIEAQIYLTVLAFVGLFSLYKFLRADDHLRLSASLIMLLAWTSVISAQEVLGDLTPVGTFVFIDFVTAVTFAWLAKSYNQLWLWWIAAFHTVSLALNAVYVMGGESNAYLYLSLMTGLSYLSLLWIVFGKRILQGIGFNRGAANVHGWDVLSSGRNRHEG